MNLAERLTRFSLAHPALTCVGVLLISVFFAAGIPRIERETTLRTFLGDDHPSVLALERHLERFGGGYPVIVGYSCGDGAPCESVFDDLALRMSAGIVQSLEGVAGIKAVHAPSNMPLFVADGMDLVVHRFVSDESGEIDPERDRLAAIAARDPLWKGVVVGGEGSVGAIVVEVGSSSGETQRLVAAKLEEALRSYREQGFEFRLVGELVDFLYTTRAIDKEALALAPAMACVLGIALYVLFRSLALTVLALLVIGIAFLWTQGAMGWAGTPINAVTSAVPSVVFAIGVHNAVHVITHYSQRRLVSGSDESRFRSLNAAVSEIGTACLLTTITTLAAFASFFLAPAATFSQFGANAEWGLFAAFLLTFTILPILLIRIPDSWLGRGDGGASWDNLLASINVTMLRRRRAILGLAALVTVVCSFGMTRLRVDVDPEQLVGENNPVTLWNRWVARNLREVETLEIALATPPGTKFQEAEVLDQIGAVAKWLESEFERLRNPRSVLDWIHRVNSLLHEGDARFTRHERERSANAQLSLLLTMNDPELLERWVSVGADSGDVLRIAVEAESMPTPIQQAVLRKIEEHLRATLPIGWSFEITGSIPVYLNMMQALLRNLVQSFGIAVLIIFAAISMVFQSPIQALLALIPAVIGSISTLGMLGLWDVGVDPASTLVATVILGVSVDDGIHMLAQYRKYRARGEDPPSASARAVERVGRAVIVSSLILAAAFWTLIVAGLESLVTFGLLSGIAVLAAMVGDLLLLPVLLATGWIARRT